MSFCEIAGGSCIRLPQVGMSRLQSLRRVKNVVIAQKRIEMKYRVSMACPQCQRRTPTVEVTKKTYTLYTETAREAWISNNGSGPVLVIESQHKCEMCWKP
jgi:hypothetical protein